MRQKPWTKTTGILPLVLLVWLIVAAGAACVRLPHRVLTTAGQNAPWPARVEATGERLINLNTATRAELETLPGIGPALAARIVEHRARYGRFRRTEHLLSVRGISERRFRAIMARLTI